MKYKQDQEKYTLTQRSITCRGSWYLQTYDIVNWIDQARELINLGAEVSVEDNSNNDEIDWDENAGEKYWDEK